MYELAPQLVDAVEQQAVERSFCLPLVQVGAALSRHVLPGLLITRSFLESTPEIVVEVYVVEEAFSQGLLFREQAFIRLDAMQFIELCCP